MRRVVLSGGMQGVEDFSYRFAKVAFKYRRVGDEVFNPAEHLVGDPNTATSEQHKQALRRCIGEIAAADLLVVLPGWENSRGASFEAFVASQIGVPIHFEEALPV